MRHAVDSMSRGLFFIALGIVFFLNTYGILPWGFWVNVLDLWPLLFILGGIALFFNKRIPFSTVLLVFLIVLVGYSFVPGVDRGKYQGPFHETSAGTLGLVVPMEDGVKKANLMLNLGGADVNLNTTKGNIDPQKVLTGNYQWRSNLTLLPDANPQLSQNTSGDTINIQFNSEKKLSTSESKLDLNLNPQLDYSTLSVNAGAINGTMDLSNLRVGNLDINSGASNMELRFGDTGAATQAKINAGASKVTLVVPDPVGLKVHVSGFTSNTNFAGKGLFLKDKEWVSPNYDSAKTKVDMTISVAAGKIDLERPQTSGITY